MEIYLKKLELEEPIEIFNLLQETVKEEWGLLDSMTTEEFPKYLEDKYNEDLGINLKNGRVPQTNYWLYVDEIPCGLIVLRRRISEPLVKRGGHIGYYIKKDYRKKGYGQKMLGLCLDLLREEGMDKVLITCDIDNKGSQKIIEGNRGILENIIDGSKRYWITIN
ncbi:GNAT family N-acetyltransferase [Psychrilyobacter atlanticus]|uniref:GNAT family N-acetyltransferase n=1 Tax=Psychrilyobacter atlanticus TaxID=271091 RepID=UPI0003F819EF|nr:GNAT family N-acetyltransferase [Psychrilyobacter atlanticus]